jgi:pentapeptide repeat protein
MTGFTCKADKSYRSACRGLSEYRNTGYCVLHYPGEEVENDDFEKVLENKLKQKDYDFRGVYFKKKAHFQRVVFNGKAVFQRATFLEGADFSWVKFENGADFSHATFEKGVTFSRATFKKEANFNHTTFKDEARFSGPPAFKDARVDFQDARMDEPKLFSMHDIELHPRWFVEVDAREFSFAKVKWYGLPGEPKGSLKDELDRSKRVKDGVSNDPLVKAFQDLSINYETNRDYKRAGEFHYCAMEAQRKALPVSNFAPLNLLWWYWLLSGYSERHKRAALGIVAILLGFAGLYMWQGPVGVQEASPVGVLQASLESIVYSLGVMTRLANAIPESDSVLVRSLIIIEGVVGPLQIALFALALRRRFMR